MTPIPCNCKGCVSEPLLDPCRQPCYGQSHVEPARPDDRKRTPCCPAGPGDAPPLRSQLGADPVQRPRFSVPRGDRVCGRRRHASPHLSDCLTAVGWPGTERHGPSLDTAGPLRDECKARWAAAGRASDRSGAQGHRRRRPGLEHVGVHRERRGRGASRVQIVANLYRNAVDDGNRAPSKHVAEVLGYSRAHAARLVGQARKVGLLGPAQKGRAGEARPKEKKK